MSENIPYRGVLLDLDGTLVDTPYDIAAAGRAGLDVIAFRCGGFSDEDLAGALAVFDGPWYLLERWEESPLGTRRLLNFKWSSAGGASGGQGSV